MIPACCIPMKAMNKPIPTPIACLTEAGIASKICFLNPVTVRITKIAPSRRVNIMQLAKVSPVPLSKRV